MNNCVVIGGGAAGMMAAVFAARNGKAVTLLEQNEKLGKKLFITGKGRCNLTNDCETDKLFENVISNPKFLYSAFYEFNSQEVMNFFEELGLRLKVERGGRVFPVSDHSSDVIKALETELGRLKVTIRLSTKAEELIVKNKLIEDKESRMIHGVRLQNESILEADSVILATGGISYPLTGANASGLKMAEKLGMKVTSLYPALVPLEIQEEWAKDLQGLSLKNISIAIKEGKKTLYEELGEMLFTHYGVSGPLILSASSKITGKIKKSQMKINLDLKPGLSEEHLDRRILRDFEEAKNKNLKNSLGNLLPVRLIPVIIKEAGLNPEKKVNEISKTERGRLVKTLKCLTMTITGTRDYNEAIITQGGISIKEINPSTMESRQIKNLFLAGECMDIDALTGGFNLQIAWSTAFLAGTHAGKNS